MKIELLKLLADQGTPLELQTEQTEDGLLVRRDGYAPVNIKGSYAVDEFTASLTHYPRSAAINGQPIETSLPPTLSRISILRPAGMDLQEQQPLPLDPEHPKGNAVAGGVLVNISSRVRSKGKPINQRQYLSLMPEYSHQNHRRLAEVHLTTMMEIKTDELDQLKKGTAIPTGSELEARVIQRVREIEERTIALPETPIPYPLRAPACVLLGEQGDWRYVRPAAIAVTGTPLVIEQKEYGTDGEFITTAQALYDNDADLVPVDLDRSPEQEKEEDPGEKENIQRTTSVEFEMVPEQPGKLALVDRITMRVTTNHGRVVEVPARFHLSGEYEDDISVRAVAGQIGVEELSELLVRTFWKEEDWSSRHEEEAARAGFEERMYNLATHVLGDNRKAIEQELRTALGRFYTNIPPPEEPVTVTSPDGFMNITMNPRT